MFTAVFAVCFWIRLILLILDSFNYLLFALLAVQLSSTAAFILLWKPVTLARLFHSCPQQPSTCLIYHPLEVTLFTLIFNTIFLIQIFAISEITYLWVVLFRTVGFAITAFLYIYIYICVLYHISWKCLQIGLYITNQNTTINWQMRCQWHYWSFVLYMALWDRLHFCAFLGVTEQILKSLACGLFVFPWKELYKITHF